MGVPGLDVRSCRCQLSGVVLRHAYPLRRALPLEEAAGGIHLAAISTPDPDRRGREERHRIHERVASSDAPAPASSAHAIAVRNIPAAAMPAAVQLSLPLLVGTTGSGGRL